MGRGLNAFNHFISWGILNRKVTPWSKITRQYNELQRSDNDYGVSRFVRLKSRLPYWIAML